MSNFKLGAKSRTNLKGVHPNMVAMVKLATDITEQDFVVYDGARTLEEQREFVRKKVSKTMKSRHLVQKDGLGHAVDLVPIIGGQARWEWGAIYPIAVAMAAAAKELGFRITWGGVWDKKMDEYPCGSVTAAKKAVAGYQKRHPGPDFIDGPHFQLEKPK